MLKLFTDFNARTPDGICWNLKLDGKDFEERARDLKPSVGDVVLLFQDEDDFEVEAVLDRRYVDILGKRVWVAVPDWSTLMRK
jgi:hypothetical protein